VTNVKSEMDIQEEVEKYLDTLRIYNFRPGADSTKSGHPDVVVCYKGHFVGLELKKPKTGKAQGHQKIIRKEIKKNGGYSFFPRSLDAVKDVLRKIDFEGKEWQR
jgi:hypothetical protein